MFAHIRAFFSRFRDIQDPYITGPNSVKEHLVLHLNHCSILFGTFFYFVSKVDIQDFALQDSISVIKITIIITRGAVV